MNKEQTQAAIAVMQAFVDGKEIEFTDTTQNQWAKIVTNLGPLWQWATTQYRIKPEVVKYRRAICRDRHSGITSVRAFRPEEIVHTPSIVRWIDTEWQEEIV